MLAAVRTLTAGIVTAFLVAVLLGAAPARAQQFADNVGPLQVELGEDGQWKAESRKGWLLLSNRIEPGSITYYFSDREPLADGTRTVRANVLIRGSGDRPSYVGLIFGRKARSSYMGFLIRNDGAVVWMNRTPDSTDFRPAEGVRARMDGTDILELRETPGKIQMVLNGAVALTAENAGGFAPSFGIVAIGTGRFGFDAFAVDETGATMGRRTPGTTEDTTTPRNDTTPVSDDQVRRVQMVLGVTLGVLFHELGHAVIGETGLPATGPEEDVADGFSAFVMSSAANEATDPNATRLLTGMVRYSALLWYYASKAKEAAGVEQSWQDEHAPDIRRFRNVFCILYGSNPGLHEDIALRFELTLETRQRCQQEYAKRFKAWEALMQTVTRKMPGDASGQHPADAPGGKIILKVQPPQSPAAREVHALVNGANAWLPKLTAYLERSIVWPNDLTIEFKHCPGVLNAWYNPQDHSITYCYELTEHFAKLIDKGEAEDGPLRDANTPAVEPARFLPGQWTAEIRNNVTGESVALTFVFNADGTYRSVVTGGPQEARTEGNWKAAAGAGGLITLELNPTRAEPAQICDQNGNCQPNRPQPARTLLKVANNDAFHMEGLDFKRQR